MEKSFDTLSHNPIWFQVKRFVECLWHKSGSSYNENFYMDAFSDLSIQWHSSKTEYETLGWWAWKLQRASATFSQTLAGH